MVRHPGGALLAMISLDQESAVPLYRQLVSQLRQAINSRQVACGTRLPSSRQLAKELGVSRLTILSAYEQLLGEGYLEARIGSGTYVGRPIEMGEEGAEQTKSRAPAPLKELLSSRGRQILKSVGALQPSRPNSFRPGVPALDAFPMRLWTRLTNRRLRTAEHEMLTYGAREGYGPLREAIARHLRDARMINCDATQIIVLGGSQRAFLHVAWTLLEVGDPVWFEDPGYHVARDAMAAAGARIEPVPLDSEGLDIRRGEADRPLPKAIYVTPSGQLPLGNTMSLDRRRELLAFAQKNRAWIIEDDFNGEHRHLGRPLPALQTLDSKGCVLHVGSFSKTLFPALRLGYLVVPHDLIEVFSAAATLVDIAAPTLPQAVLADFISEGHLQSHLRRMRPLYARRQRLLVEALRERLGGFLEVAPAEAGMHLVAWLPESQDDRAASRRARARGIDALPLSSYSLHPSRPGLLIGFACVECEQIGPGVRRLAEALIG